MLWIWLIFPPRSHPSPRWQQNRTAAVPLCADVRRWPRVAVETVRNERDIRLMSYTRFALATIALWLCQSVWSQIAAISVCVGGRCEPFGSGWADTLSGNSPDKLKIYKIERVLSLFLQKGSKRKQNSSKSVAIEHSYWWRKQCVPDEDVLNSPSSRAGGRCF